MCTYLSPAWMLLGLMLLNNLFVRFDQTLIIVLALSIIGEYLFLLTTIHFTDTYYVPFLQPFGWIFWLGLLQFIIPLFVSREKAFKWFQKEFLWGSLILFSLHLVLLIIVTQVAINSFY